MNKHFAVVIPAYHPSMRLPEYVQELDEEGVPLILIVNDGNNDDYGSVFEECALLPTVKILTHSVNKGKGAALKTAFRYYLAHTFDLNGLVTADSDDQHTVEDVLKIGDMLSSENTDFILGRRYFEYGRVPTRSYIGNTITRFAFKVLFKSDIRDTQTGLRGFSTEFLNRMIDLRGERFDYEMNMLIFAAKHDVTVSEVDIQTIYHENHFSNYHSYRDSVRIIRHIWKGFISRKKKETAETKEEVT